MVPKKTLVKNREEIPQDALHSPEMSEQRVALLLHDCPEKKRTLQNTSALVLSQRESDASVTVPERALGYL